MQKRASTYTIEKNSKNSPLHTFIFQLHFPAEMNTNGGNTLTTYICHTNSNVLFSNNSLQNANWKGYLTQKWKSCH